MPLSLQRFRRRPRKVFVTKPESQKMAAEHTHGFQNCLVQATRRNIHSRVLGVISKPVSCMQDTQIIDILNIALLKVETESKFFSQKMDCIKRFSLGLSYRRDVG